MKINLGKIITSISNRAAKILGEGEISIISLIREIFKNFSILGFIQIINLIINLIIAILLVRWLGAVAFGQYAIAISLTGIVFGITNFGIGGILTREISKDLNVAEEYLGNSLGILILVSLPLGIAISYFLALVIGFKGETLLLVGITSIYVGISGIVGLFYCLFQAVGKFEYQFKINLFYKTFSLLGCFLLLQKGFGLFSIMLLFVFLQSLSFLWAANKNFKTICPVKIKLDLAFWRLLIRESVPLSFAGTAEFINNRIDAVILGAIKGERVAGIYNGAYNVYLGATALPYAFGTAFFPTFSRTYETSNENASILFRDMMIIMGGISLILSLTLSIFSDEIIRLIFGQKLISSSVPLMILAWALPLANLNRLCNLSLVAMGLQNYMFYLLLSGATFNVITNIIIVPRYSYLGASITTVITEGFVLIGGILKIRSCFAKSK